MLGLIHLALAGQLVAAMVLETVVDTVDPEKHAELFLGKCFMSARVCDPTDGNLIEDVFSVDTLDKCRDQCSNRVGCKFITHYGDSFCCRNRCELFKNCTALRHCADEEKACRTEDRECFDPCSLSIEHRVDGENHLGRIDGANADTCKAGCSNKQHCSLYFLRGDVCYLLSHFKGPARRCSDCTTGFPDCDNNVGFRHLDLRCPDCLPL